jgi:hypothetical protein
MAEYYSDQLSGPRSRTETDFTERSWGGIVALVERSVANNVFADEFPEQCADGRGVCATDERSLRLAVLAEHPEVTWPLDAHHIPKAPAVLDLIEYLHGISSDPVLEDYHSYFGHHHLSFNRYRGQELFRNQVNRIFARNGLAYELQENGRARRLLESVLHEQLGGGLPASGDDRVDELVSQAEERFLDPDPGAARDALEKLWDAFERVKTVLDPDKKTGASKLIEAATSTAQSAELVGAEMKSLTEIGNSFHIRHHETTRHPVPDELVDYLFVRMYVLLRLLIGGIAANPDR